MADDSLTNWTRDYLSKLQRSYATGSDPLQSLSPGEVATQLIASGEYQGSFNTGNLPTQPHEPGVWSRVMDVLSRPLYGTANAVAGSFKQINDPTYRRDSESNVFTDVGRGLAGYDKTTGRDVVEAIDEDAPNWVKGVGGLAFDLTADPLNAIAFPVSALSKGKRAAKGLKDSIGEEEDIADSVLRELEPSPSRRELEPGSTPEPEPVATVNEPSPSTNGPFATPYRSGGLPKEPQLTIGPGRRPIIIPAAKDVPAIEPPVGPGVVAGPDGLSTTGSFGKEGAADITIAQSRINSLVNALEETGSGRIGFQNFDDFVRVARNGELAQSAVDKVLDAAGVSDIRHVKPVFESMKRDLEKAQDSFSKARYGSVDPKTIAARQADEQNIAAFEARAAEAQKVKDEIAAEARPTIEMDIAPPITKPGLPNDVSKAVNEALHRNRSVPGQMYDQARLAADITTQVSKRLKETEGKVYRDSKSGAKRLYVPEFSKRKMETAINDVEAAIQSKAADGVFPRIVSPLTNKEYLASIADVWKALPEDIVKGIQFDARRMVLPSQQLAGAARAIDLLHMPAGPEKAAEIFGAAKAAKSAGAKAVDDADIQVMADAMAADNFGFMMHGSLVENAKKYGTKDIRDSDYLSAESITSIRESLADPTKGMGDVASEITDMTKKIQDRGKTIGASGTAEKIAASRVAEATAKVINEGDVRAVRTMTRVAHDRAKFGSKADQKISDRMTSDAKVIGDEFEGIARKELGVDTLDLDVATSARHTGIFARLMYGIGTKFKFGYGQGELADVVRNGINVAHDDGVRFTRVLRDIDQKHQKVDIQTAFSAMRRGLGITDETPSSVAAAFNDLAGPTGVLFDISRGPANDPLLGGFFRNGAKVEAINRELKAVGLPQFQFDLAKAKGDFRAMADQWRAIDIDDPVDFLSKAHSAISILNAKTAVGLDFSAQWGRKSIPAGAAKGDWVRIKGGTEIGPHINAGMYYPREAATWLHHLEEQLRTPRSFKGEKGAIAGFANSVIDPVLSVWKPAMTIIRPGHHIRNLIGDLGMGMLDGVYTKAPYMKAIHVMKSGGQFKTAAGIEGYKSLKQYENAGSSFVKVRVGRKTEGLSPDNVYRIAYKHGLLNEYHTIEDIERASSKIGKALTENKLVRGGGWVSEKVSHGGRLGHFIALMERPSFTRGFNSIDEAAEAAVTRVQKFHPDVSGLTKFEQRYMRRVFPFYTWIRQAMPIVLTTMLRHPGRITMVPKAMFNVATAMGVNPNSLTDPFPEDKLYPSFIRDNLTGPLIGSRMFNFGTPVEGAADIFNGNIGRNIASMANPVFKAPIEMLSGSNIGTGANISDMGEYIDSQLPYVNQVANISGYSPTGSIGNIFGDGPIPDPQRAMQRGEKEAFFNTSLANFMTGLGWQDVDKQSYRNIAANEIRRG